MGGRGSGSFPDDGSTHRGGRQKKSAVAVSGSGFPVKPRVIADSLSDVWEEISDRLAGVAFEQDSAAVYRLALLTYQQDQIDERWFHEPCDEDLSKQSLAVGRQLIMLWGQFGMTPRSRQILLVPKEEEEADEFEKMMKDRG